ncbi:MAG: hypothetical protein JWM65_1399 [Sphingomonas bacterium]|jgi:hypothetical protein|nr:hypothetical protein [Sphingomonas bacterium]
MYNPFEDFGELLEDIESDESDEAFESDEAAPRRGKSWGKVPTAKRGNPVPQKVANGFATKADLNAVAQRLDGRIATNSKAIATVDGRTRAIEAEAHKLRASLKHEIAERTKATDALKKGLDDARQLAMILPLLSTTETVTIGTQQNVVVDNGDQMSKLLPIMLLSGGFGGSSGSGGGGMFGDGGMGPLVMMMALAK